jgi:hypothetical protein
LAISSDSQPKKGTLTLKSQSQPKKDVWSVTDCPNKIGKSLKNLFEEN